MQTLPNVLRPFSHIKGGFSILRRLNRALLKRGIEPIQQGQMRDGTRIQIDLRSQTEWFAFYSGSYDDDEILLIARLLRGSEGGFLDVGGNIGMYSVRVGSTLDPAQRVYCFEPMPDNAARIAKNALMNKLGDTVSVIECALSDKEGFAQLVLREDFEMGSVTGNASIAISKETDKAFKTIEVKTRRFDDIRKEMNIGPLPVAKVDIEGHEDFFLRGAQDYISSDRPIILAEINNWFYERRGTTTSIAFRDCIPKDYSAALLLGRQGSRFLHETHIEDLSKVRDITTCILFPQERSAELQRAVSMH